MAHIAGWIGYTSYIFYFLIFCVVSFVYAKKKLFETKGKSLEEIEKALAK